MATDPEPGVSPSTGAELGTGDERAGDLRLLLRAALKRCRACRPPDRCTACQTALAILDGQRPTPARPVSQAPRWTR